MARQLSLVSATLMTAAFSGLMPTVVDHLSSPPTPPATIMPGPAMPSTAPAGGVPATLTIVPRASGNLPASTSLEVPQSGITILNLDASARLTFRGPDETSSRTRAVSPLVRNTTDRDKTVAITLFAQDRTGQEITCLQPAPSSFSVPAHKAAFQTISLPVCGQESASKLAYPLTGFARLIISPAETVEAPPRQATFPASEPGITFVPLSISGPPTCSSVATLAFLVPLALVAGVVLITIASLEAKKIHLRNRMGNSSWNFGQSWGANIAIAGALTGAVLTTTILPDHPSFMSRDSYTMLQAIFAAIIALAPPVYALFRRDVVAVCNGVVSTDSQGYVIMFLISGGLVLWGAIGQVTTLGMLLLELIGSRNLPEGVGDALLALAALLGVFLIIYGLRSLYKTAKDLSVPSGVAVHPPLPFPVAEGTLLSAAEAATLAPPLRAWPVL